MTKAGLDGPVVSKIIVLKNSKIIERVKLELTFAFSTINIGLISFYLGLKMQQNWENQTIKLLQLVYIEKIFNKFYYNKAFVVKTLIKKTALFKQKI